MTPVRAGVVGVTGYGGAEICRILLQHPRIELAAAHARSAAGLPLGEVLPGLSGLTKLVVGGLAETDLDALAALDVVFLATPHGASRTLAEALDRRACPRIVDLSADHRHKEQWVYAQADFPPEQLLGATRLAVPGCFATALSLSLAPFVRAGLLDGPAFAVGITGSTGSGAEPSATTHHPERFHNLRAYKVLDHQHVPEVLAFLRGLGAIEGLSFVPQSGPFDRGIFTTTFLRPAPGVPTTAFGEALAAAYAGQAMIRLRGQSPEIRHVRGTGFCDLHLHVRDGVPVVLAALDNLGKGAAFHALQGLHLALGWPKDEGLLLAPALP